MSDKTPLNISAASWDQRYRESSSVPEACYCLTRFSHLLPDVSADLSQAYPAEGRAALDVACGLGGNALFLSEQGFETHAWDVSGVALSKLQQSAEKCELTIHTEVRDIQALPPQTATFDVIVVSRFLDRTIIAALIDALRHNGVLFYQTFTVHARSGPKNPDYLLKDNELLELFASLRIRAFEDFQDESFVVAQKV